MIMYNLKRKRTTTTTTKTAKPVKTPRKETDSDIKFTADATTG